MDAKMSKLMESLPDVMDYSKTTTIDDLNAKFEIPGDMDKDNIRDIVNEGNENKLLLTTIVFNKFNRHEYVSYFKDIQPNLECCFKYFKDEKRTLIDSRENIINMMKDAFHAYDTICIPRIELSEDGSGVDITDILIYNKEDLW